MRFFTKLRHLLVPHQGNAYRPHLLRQNSLMFLLGLALAAEALLMANLFARQSGSEFLAAVIQSEILALTNVERAQHNVEVLIQNEILNRSAQAKADDMAAKGYFSHNSPDGTQPWVWIEEAGYEYQYAGENLAVRFVDSKDVVVAWMASPTHRANIVKPVYTQLGIGIAQGMYKGQPATFVVQHFAKPAASVAVAAAIPETEPVAPAEAPAAELEPPAAVEVLGTVAQAAAPATGAPSATFGDSLARVLGKLAAEPRSSAGWILGGVSLLLMIALAFAFLHHVQIQSRAVLAPGALVAAVALSLFVFNSHFLTSGLFGNTQAASPASAGLERGVVLSPEAAIVQR